MTDLVLRALKVSLVTLVSGLSALWAQFQIPLEGLGSVSLVAVLAVLIGRYTFRQLEDFRKDLREYRSRIDELEDELHKQGQSKAAVEKRNRDLEEYAHRLHLWVLAVGGSDSDVPPPPAPATS